MDGALAGVGGITADFVDPAGLRMRRFYVRPAYRRLGVARALATRVIETALPLGRPIVLYTETDAGAAFWETMGFARIKRENTAHLLVETSPAPPRGSTGSP
jgi:GNAT superfamily N-acetyltransferase